MKKTVNALILLAFVLLSVSASGQEPIDYDTQVFDFGHVAIDFNLFHSFRYVNKTFVVVFFAAGVFDLCENSGK